MPGVPFEPYTSTNTRTGSLGHRAIHGTPIDDNSSIFTHSTNSTVSNLVGTGRVIGNLYSFTGKRLERALGDIAHRVGLGPEAVYEKICALSQDDWRRDNEKGENTIFVSISCSLTYVATAASALQNLCFKLFEHFQYVSRQNILSPLLIIVYRSTVDRTRFQAIKRWGDILQDHHEIFVWLYCNKKQETVALSSDLIRNVEGFREAVECSEDVDILDRTALLIDCHSVGLEFISLSRGRLLMDSRVVEVEWQGPQQFSVEEVEKLEMFFQYLLDSIVYVGSSDSSSPLTANFDP